MDAVLFDLDGTLIDTTGAILESLQHTVWYFTGKRLEPQEFKPYLGMTLDEVLDHLVPDNAQAARDVYVKHNLGIHDGLVKAFPGAVDTVNAMKKRGLKTAIVTSKRRHSAEVGMRVTGLTGLFDAQVYYEDTELHKPDPAPIVRALSLLGVKSGRALMVGDSIFDIKAAKNAVPILENVDLKSVGAAYGPSGRDALSREHPDFLIDSVGDLITICESDRSPAT